MKKKLVLILAGIALTASLTAYAAEPKQAPTPNTSQISHGGGMRFGSQVMADVVAKLTNMSSEDVLKARAEGKTYYEIATSKGVKAETFKDSVLKEKSSLVDQRVKDGTLTKEQGDFIKSRVQSNMENCNGQGNGSCGAGSGKGKRGMGRGQGGGCAMMGQPN